MLRRSSIFFLGYVPVNPDTSPMVGYSNYHWHYNLPQGMEGPSSINRSMPAPFESPQRNVNKYHGVWVELDIHPAFRVALDSYLKKLPLSRQIPRTDPMEAVKDFKAVSPRVADVSARDAWLAKVIQLCAFHRRADAALELWKDNCHERLIVRGETPPLPLVKSILFCLNKSLSAEWRPIFNMCLKDGWNYTPLFEISSWSYLLKCAGRLNDGKGVRAILEEMLDVQAHLDSVTASTIAIALNAITEPDDYNFMKKFLFNFGSAKTTSIAKAYSSIRGHASEKLRVPMKENDVVYYHVCWHSSIRQSQKFSPRQLYFDYKPSSLSKSALNPSSKMDDIVKEKIEKWKSEGVLPQDYVHEEKWYDRASAFKIVFKQDRWKKLSAEQDTRDSFEGSR